MFRKKKIFFKSLEPKVKIEKVPGEMFYDPSNGLYIPARRIPRCSGRHSQTDLYWQPCLECVRFCNCTQTQWFPDIIVTTSDNETIRVKSVVVAGSGELVAKLNKLCSSAKLTLMRDLLKIKNGSLTLARNGETVDHDDEILINRKIDVDRWALSSRNRDESDDDDIPKNTWEMWAPPPPINQGESVEIRNSSEEEEDVEFGGDEDVTMTTTLNDSGFGAAEEPDFYEDSSPEFQELIEFPPELPAFTLKDENWKSYGLTTSEWRWIEKFLILHRDQVDEEIEAEKRAREYFRLSMFARPAKDPVNPWRYYDWEEDLFANLSQAELFGITRAVQELMIYDLYIPLVKWMTLLRGIPRVVDFGRGDWLTELTPEMCDSGVEDFCEESSRPMWDYGSPQMHSLHKAIPKRQRPRSTLLWRKRIWKPYPQFSTRWWNS